jgi:hypothetical protein
VMMLLVIVGIVIVVVIIEYVYKWIDDWNIWDD